MIAVVSGHPTALELIDEYVARYPETTVDAVCSAMHRYRRLLRDSGHLAPEEQAQVATDRVIFDDLVRREGSWESGLTFTAGLSFIAEVTGLDHHTARHAWIESQICKYLGATVTSRELLDALYVAHTRGLTRVEERRLRVLQLAFEAIFGRRPGLVETRVFLPSDLIVDPRALRGHRDLFLTEAELRGPFSAAFAVYLRTVTEISGASLTDPSCQTLERLIAGHAALGDSCVTWGAVVADAASSTVDKRPPRS